MSADTATRAMLAPGSRRKERGRLFAHPVAGGLRIVLFLIYAVPLLWIVLTSLKSPADVIASQSSLLFRPTIDAYVEALSNAGLYTAMQQSFVIAAGTTALTLAIAIPAGYGLARVDSSVTTIVLGALIVFQMLPQTANVIPLFQIFGQWGLLDTNLGLIIADTALLTPFAVLLLRPFFRAVPVALEEAAMLDGASTVRGFWSALRRPAPWCSCSRGANSSTRSTSSSAR